MNDFLDAISTASSQQKIGGVEHVKGKPRSANPTGRRGRTRRWWRRPRPRTPP
jgi:hypothetical protein